MVEYSDMHWKEGKLYLGNLDTSIRLIEDTKTKGMFWLEWSFENPGRSIRSYNISAAKDNARKLYQRYANRITEEASEKPSDAFN